MPPETTTAPAPIIFNVGGVATPYSPNGVNFGTITGTTTANTGVLDEEELADEKATGTQTDEADQYTLSDTTLAELYLDGEKATQEGDLIWKTVLRTGTWLLRPGPGQVPMRKPLKVVEGTSEDPQKEIGLQDIINSYADKAIEHVTIPLSHADKTEENTGFVRELKIEGPDADGVFKLRAGFEFTEPDIKQKAVNGSIANTSVGLLFDYQRKSDAKRYPIALAHVALTNRPWINGMEPFGIAASEGEPEVISLELATSIDGVKTHDPLNCAECKKHMKSGMNFCPECGAAASGELDIGLSETVWSSTASLNYLRYAVQEALNNQRDPHAADEGGMPGYYVHDISPGKALVCDQILDNSNWIVPFTTNDKGEVTLADNKTWVEAKQEWIAAAQNFAQEAEDQPTAQDTAKPKRKPAAEPESTNELALAQAAREKLVVTTNVPDLEGGTMSGTTNALDGLELSDEARDLFEKQQQDLAASQVRLDALDKKDRERAVEEKVAQLSEQGFDQFPGFLKAIRDTYKSDDGGAALVLSEDGTHTKLTASEIVDRVIDALPRKDGKLNFGEQIPGGKGLADEKPPVTAEGENKTVEERAAEARTFLGLDK